MPNGSRRRSSSRGRPLVSRTVLITGGAGFLGSHTADALAARGWSVRIVDNLQSEVHAGAWPRYILRKGYELLRGDVRDPAVWRKALRGVRVVIHLAAYQDQRDDFSTFFTTNTVSTALLYESIAGARLPVRRVLLASSQFVYGDGAWKSGSGRVFFPELRSAEDLRAGRFEIPGPDGKPARPIPFREDQPVNPTNSYGLSKHALEMAGLRLGKTCGVPTTVMRYSIMQGARQSPRNIYSGALRIFVSQALAGTPITVYEDGRQLRDFVNIHDAVRANLLVLRSRDAAFRIFNVGGGRGVRVIDFAKQVQRITASASAIVVGGYRRTDTRHAVSDIGALRRLGWAPRSDTAASIREYADWYRAEGFHRTADVAALRALQKGIA